MFELRYLTPNTWTLAAASAMDEFLPDHASAEYNASGTAFGVSFKAFVN